MEVCALCVLILWKCVQCVLDLWKCAQCVYWICGRVSVCVLDFVDVCVCVCTGFVDVCAVCVLDLWKVIVPIFCSALPAIDMPAGLAPASTRL